MAVAIFILWSGWGLIRDTINPLLGAAPDAGTVEEIRKSIMAYPGVLGTHDLMLHDYGPGRRFASVHVEVAAEDDVLKSHELVDEIERDFHTKRGISLVGCALSLGAGFGAAPAWASRAWRWISGNGCQAA